VGESIALLAMVVVALLQLAWVVQKASGLAVNKVWVNRHLDAISRGADVAYGSEFQAYMDFLRVQIPTEATVVDTRTFGLPQYDQPGFVQYFLFPRSIIPLTDETCHGEPHIEKCIIDLSGSQTYFMYGANYTPSAVMSESFQVLPFGGDLGLLAPSAE
jgi:hypothetical protein